MIGIFVFVASFSFFFGVTMRVPDVPPGQILVDALRNSETNYLIAGISGELLISAIINGFIWGISLLIIYSYFKSPQKRKTSLPVWVPGHTTSRTSKEE